MNNFDAAQVAGEITDGPLVIFEDEPHQAVVLIQGLLDGTTDQQKRQVFDKVYNDQVLSDDDVAEVTSVLQIKMMMQLCKVQTFTFSV